jgi:dTDP-4-amino-4,6-dideoxygalactose transaminase
MNEVEAAFGLLQLKHIDKALEERKAIHHRYRELLKGLEGLTFVDVPDDVSWNHAYFPVLIEPKFGMSRDDVYTLFKADGILTRRYFYPLISSFAMYRGSLLLLKSICLLPMISPTRCCAFQFIPD